MTTSYAGPPGWQIPELISRQHVNHRYAIERAHVARFLGDRSGHAKFLGWARMARFEIEYLKACQCALATRWRV